MKRIRESDWKRLRDLKPIALERFCDRVLLELEQARSDAASSSHQRYLAIYDLIRERDEELGYIFDGLSRSSAIGKLLLMHRAGLLTEEDVAGFSEELKDAIAQSQDD
jgi:ABC-type uncharacterized transport system ATPase subunit